MFANTWQKMSMNVEECYGVPRNTMDNLVKIFGNDRIRVCAKEYQ